MNRTPSDSLRSVTSMFAGHHPTPRGVLCVSPYPVVVLVLVVAAFSACREPHTAQTNIAGQTQFGYLTAEPIFDPAIVSSGKFLLYDPVIDPLKTLIHDLLSPDPAELEQGVIGMIDMACTSEFSCDTDSDCLDAYQPLFTCDLDLDEPRCVGNGAVCTTDSDCTWDIACIDNQCLKPACADWEPNPKVLECSYLVLPGTDTCADRPEDYCMTLYWNRAAAGPNMPKTPVASDHDFTDLPLDLLSVSGNNTIGCVQVPVNLGLPTDILGTIPLLRVKTVGLPSISRYTTLGAASKRVCDELGCSEDAPVNVAGIWFGAEVVPEDPISASVTCSLDTATNSSQLCAQFLANIPAIAKAAVVSAGCEAVKFQIKINSIPLKLGLVPHLSAPGGGQWTSQLFSGAKDFHLDDMFRVTPVIAGTPTIQFGDMNANVDIAADVDLWGSKPPFMCDVAQGAAQGELNGIIKNRLTGAIASMHRLIERTVFPYFMYNNAKLPEACSVFSCLPDSDSDIPCCFTEGRIQRWARAAITYQKWHWFAGAFGPYEQEFGDGWLPILNVATETDGYPECDGPTGYMYEHCDGIYTHIWFYFDNDQDKDGILTPDDLAPQCNTLYNLDSDGDGVVDDCDQCPNDPFSVSDELGQGGDGDGVCGDIDNCPLHYNPTQSNCNEDAERVFSPEMVLGDACDPVPCPAVVADYNYSSGKAHQCKKLSGLFVSPLLPQPYKPAPGEPKVPANWPVYDVSTSAYFCVDDPVKGIDCMSDSAVSEALAGPANCAPSYPGDSDCVVSLNNPWPIPEVPSTWYHRIDIEESSSHVVKLDYTHLPGEYTIPLTWNWEADRDRWLATGLIDPSTITGQPLAGTSSIYGRLWLHSASKQGTTSFPEPGIHGKYLSNHYAEIATVTCKPKDLFQIPMFSKCVIDPASCFELPWKPDIYINPADLVARFDAVSPVEASMIVKTQSGRNFGAILHDGQAELVDSRLGPAANALMNTDGVKFIGASEPSLAIGKDPSAPSVVAIGSDGRVLGLLYSVGSELLEHADFGRGVGNTGGLPYSSFKVTYARSKTRLYAVGLAGEKGFGHEVWSFDLLGHNWAPVAQIPDADGDVLTVTYRFAGDKLVWLSGDGSVVRYYEMDIETGKVDMVWKGESAFVHHHLAIDNQGEVLLLASMVKQPFYTMYRLARTKGSLVVVGSTKAEAVAPFAPVTDTMGVTVLEVDPNNGVGRGVRKSLKEMEKPVELDLISGM